MIFAPSPIPGVPYAPDPTQAVGGWASGGGASGLANTATGVGINQAGVIVIILFVAMIFMAMLGFKQQLKSPEGNVKLAGQQSVVMGIGSSWIGIAVFIGAAVIIGGLVKLILSVLAF